MVTLISQNLSEFDLHARAVLGLPIPHIEAVEGASAVVLADIEGKNPSYSGVSEALEEPNVDVRIFDETSTNIIEETRAANGYTKYYANIPGGNWSDLTAQRNSFGREFQLKWRPWQEGQWTVGHLWIDNGQLYPRKPSTSYSLMVTQRFAPGIHLSLMRSHTDAVQEMPYAGVPAPEVNRTDVRIAKDLRWGSRKGELSFVVQNVGPAYLDYAPNFQFVRQAYVMVRLEN